MLVDVRHKPQKIVSGWADAMLVEVTHDPYQG